jgi:sorbitol-specific phosphotransferase system component IIBC
MNFIVNLLKANSKAVAGVVGVLLGLLVARGLIPPEWNTPDTQLAIVSAITGFIVWVSPANKPPGAA